MPLSQVAEYAYWVRPEILLVAFILTVIIANLMKGLKRFTGAIAVFGLALTGLVTFRLLSVLGPNGIPPIFESTYTVDSLATLFKVAFLGSGVLVAIISIPAIRGWKSGKGEYFA